MYSKAAGLAMAVTLLSLLATSGFAGTKDWKVQADDSYANISSEAKTREGRQTVSLGEARVSGILHLDREKIADSTFEFEMKPDSNPENAAVYTMLTFRSQSAKLTADGFLRVTGPLTLREMKVEAQLDGNEGYCGPEYTGRVTKESVREASFLVSLPEDDPVDARGQPGISGTAEARIFAEDYPELVAAVLATNWPEISPEHSLPVITRTAISFGEDYPGEDPGVAEVGDDISLALHLWMTQEGVALTAAGSH